ncbi:hypothetical protein BKH43_07465 [Helicobacter sp. 13S00401-1]|uniref:Panacea domain-containing protein n=1 Tax=Helicobacter sp. 13S00401-1 TaxID=1905758 RepID=UPI000BA743D2|nr:type II toxin-antitoxin system antitoxin SocA domain-containing protein [Helicobacter sp. 13S00401-1]PAF49023.1 hypothetical protein BKH43_07465 [Helicobacter sp. 13S00401-1]
MKALDLAKGIINHCLESGYPISNLSLQKILYLSNNFYIINTGNFLIDDENFYAWKFGPVIPSVYKQYAFYAGDKFLIPEDGAINFNDTLEFKDKSDLLERFLGFVRYCANQAPWDLVKYTHKVGGAWDKVFDKGVGVGRLIPKEYIEQEANSFKD